MSWTTVGSPRPALLVLGLGGAVAAVSSAALFILLAHPLPSLVIAAGRVLVTGLLLLLLGLPAVPRTLAALRSRAMAGRVLVAAALLAVHFGGWVASLTMTSVPRSVTLVAAQPLLAGLLGRLVGDRASPALYAGALVAVGGTAVMVGGLTGGGVNPGDGLALLAGAAAAGYLVVGRSVRERLPLRPYLALVHLLAAGMLAVLLPWSSASAWSVGATASEWLAVLYLGVVPGLVGHGVINWVVRHVPVHVAALAFLLEPVGATGLAALALGQPVRPEEVAGAAVVLLGVALGLVGGSGGPEPAPRSPSG